MFAVSKPIIDQGSSPAGETDRPTRQFRVTHTATGIETYVMAPVYPHRDGVWRGDPIVTASRAGLRFLVDCTVAIVPKGQEIPLPFDALPLVIRRQPEPAA